MKFQIVSQIGMFLVPALNIPMLLFAGFFVKLPQVSIYLQIFSTTSYFRQDNKMKIQKFKKMKIKLM